MTYHINEIFYSIQGEGYWTGRPAVFVRFSRCNLWTGREQDRPKAICKFCDTDFTAAERLDLDDLLDWVYGAWPSWPLGKMRRMVVLTGGEPALQVDPILISVLHKAGFYIAIETNGTRRLADGIDWICVSPKAGSPLQVRSGDELKLVYPQWIDPADLEHLDFAHFWLSPMDGPNLAQHTAAALEYVLAHPQWRLNIQTHKVIGVR